MPRLHIHWVTKDDEKVCPICSPLHGYRWEFWTAKDPFPSLLTHPLQGDVWDTDRDEPRTHGQHPHNCRCRLVWTIDTRDLTEQLRTITAEMRQYLEQLEVDL